MRLKYLLVAFCLLIEFSASAQSGNGSVSIQPIYTSQAKPDDDVSGNFCSVLMQLVSDASASFSRAKGKELETDANTAIWTANMGLPGAKTSSLIFTTSWQYEGVIYQGVSVDDMHIYYDKYKKLLEDCVPAKGYELKTEKNMEPKLEKYPEIIYSRPSGDAPAISMKVDYADNTGTYTLTVNIWKAGR